MKIKITDVEHRFRDEKFNKTRINYQVYEEDKLIRTSRTNVRKGEDVSFEELKQVALEKEENRPVKTREDGLHKEKEIKDKKEILDKEEEL